MTSIALPASLRIGVFDSGIGGLSVLKKLQQTLPGASWLFLSDSGHGPYGERDASHVLTRSRRAAAFLRSQGAQALVIACNTATAMAVSALRDEHACWPIVGVEPGLKPAIAMTRTGHVGVMATEATLRSDRFERLLRATRGDVEIHLQACPGLAWAIEQDEPDSPLLASAIENACAPLRRTNCDVVVLGCTHYPLIRDHLQRALGDGIRLLDTGSAVARQTVRRVATLAHAPLPAATLALWSSGDVAALSAAVHRHLRPMTMPSAMTWPG